MEAYRPIMLNLTHLVALWAITYISSSLTPQNLVEYAVLAVASLWMLYATALLNRAKRRPSAVFFGICALMPWCFYLELWYINQNNQDIAPEVFEANLQHAIFVYQSFKYMFLICGFAAACKGLYQAIREFASTGRD